MALRSNSFRTIEPTWNSQNFPIQRQIYCFDKQNFSSGTDFLPSTFHKVTLNKNFIILTSKHHNSLQNNSTVAYKTTIHPTILRDLIKCLKGLIQTKGEVLAQQILPWKYIHYKQLNHKTFTNKYLHRSPYPRPDLLNSWAKKKKATSSSNSRVCHTCTVTPRT